MKSVLVLGLGLAMALTGCGGGKKSAGCYHAGERCFSNRTGENAAEDCALEGGEYRSDGCPANELCLGICDIEGTPVYFYYPGYIDVAAAQAECEAVEWWTWETGCGGETLPDWFSAPCSDFGGQTTSGGACFVACESRNDCPVPGLDCGNQVNRACVRVGCGTASDCGPSGWACQYGTCYLTCQVLTPGEQSTECPEGWACEAGMEVPAVCSVIQGSTTCGEPCPAGCCSPSGLTCCKPPFCDGDCAGSGCC